MAQGSMGCPPPISLTQSTRAIGVRKGAGVYIVLWFGDAPGKQLRARPDGLDRQSGEMSP